MTQNSHIFRNEIFQLSSIGYWPFRSKMNKVVRLILKIQNITGKSEVLLLRPKSNIPKYLSQGLNLYWGYQKKFELSKIELKIVTKLVEHSYQVVYCVGISLTAGYRISIAEQVRVEANRERNSIECGSTHKLRLGKSRSWAPCRLPTTYRSLCGFIEMHNFRYPTLIGVIGEANFTAGCHDCLMPSVLH